MSRLLSKFALLAGVAVIAGCTISPDDAAHPVQVNIPVVAKNWSIDSYADAKSRTEYCVVSSGMNGLDVVIAYHRPTGTVIESVQSSRPMNPGNVLALRVNNHHYRTPSPVFSQTAAKAIISDLASGDTLYLEWSGMYVGEGNSPNRVHNMVKLENFSQQYQECKRGIK